MTHERAAMLGRVADARNRAQRLKLRVEGLAGSLRLGLNVALTPAEELDVPQLSDQMGQLVEAWSELQASLSDISRLERELQ